MKNFLIIYLTLTLVLIHSNTFAQDNSDILTISESKFLNAKFEAQRKAFDFSEKKIAFAIGNNGHQLRTKEEYFNEAIDFQNSNQEIIDNLILFTQIEKNESGGYDGVVVSWSKVGVSEKARRKIIEKLKKAST